MKSGGVGGGEEERGSLLFQKSFCTLSQFTFVIVVIVAGSLSLDFLYLEVMLQEISRIRAQQTDFHLEQALDCTTMYTTWMCIRSKLTVVSTYLLFFILTPIFKADLS